MKKNIFVIWTIAILLFFSSCVNTRKNTTKEDKKITSICNEVNNKIDRNECYFRENKVRNEKVICDKIENKSLKLLCYNDLAIAKKDDSLCQEKESLAKTACIVAIKKDEKLCLWWNSDQKKICNAIIKQDENICDWLDICYWELAKLKNDVNICDKIKNNTTKTMCILWIAVVKNDDKICDKIKKESHKKECKWYATKFGN